MNQMPQDDSHNGDDDGPEYRRDCPFDTTYIQVARLLHELAKCCLTALNLPTTALRELSMQGFAEWVAAEHTAGRLDQVGLQRISELEPAFQEEVLQQFHDPWRASSLLLPYWNSICALCRPPAGSPLVHISLEMTMLFEVGPQQTGIIKTKAFPYFPGEPVHGAHSMRIVRDCDMHLRLGWMFRQITGVFDQVGLAAIASGKLPQQSA